MYFCPNLLLCMSLKRFLSSREEDDKREVCRNIHKKRHVSVCVFSEGTVELLMTLLSGFSSSLDDSASHSKFLRVSLSIRAFQNW